MSVKVDLDRLADALADYPLAYLITVGDDFHAHAVVVDPVLVDGVLDIGTVGRTTRRNVAAHDVVTVLWPPPDAGEYSLIVDGCGQFIATDDDRLRVVPDRAVLHRKAAGAPGSAPTSGGGCLHDCVPLED